MPLSVASFERVRFKSSNDSPDFATKAPMPPPTPAPTPPIAADAATVIAAIGATAAPAVKAPITAVIIVPTTAVVTPRAPPVHPAAAFIPSFSDAVMSVVLPTSLAAFLSSASVFTDSKTPFEFTALVIASSVFFL